MKYLDPKDFSTLVVLARLPNQYWPSIRLIKSKLSDYGNELLDLMLAGGSNRQIRFIKQYAGVIQWKK